MVAGDDDDDVLRSESAQKLTSWGDNSAVRPMQSSQAQTRCRKTKKSLRSSSPLEVGAQPLETLVETVTTGGASGLDEPLALSQAVKAKLVGDLGGVHGVGQILLVGENKEQSVTQLVLVKHALQLLTCLGNTLSVVRVDDEDDTVRVLEVVPPEGADLVLSSDVPNGERDVLVFDGLDVEA